MRYAKKRVKLPTDMRIGSKIGVVGDGSDTYEIEAIIRDGDGDVVDIHISSGWREPLSKIYLLRGRDHFTASQDQSSWIDVAIRRM